MVRGMDVRVVRGTAARTLGRFSGISAVLGAAMGCSAESAVETPPPTEVVRGIPRSPTAAGDRAMGSLAALLGHPVEARAPDTPTLRIDARRPANEGVLLRHTPSGVAVVARIEGAAPVAAEVVAGVTVYPAAAPSGADNVVVPSPSGFEDWVLLSARPPGGRSRASITYEITLQNVAGLRLVAGVLELLDASGTPRLRARSPALIDSAKTWHTAHFELPDCAADTSPAPPWGRPVRAPGRASCRLVVAWDDARVAYPAALDPTWESTAESLAAGRKWHTATPLGADPASPVLLAGGFDAGAAVKTAELYQPLSRTFSSTGDLAQARGAHAAAALADGRVLVIGGAASVSGASPSGALASIERYDPATGAFTALGATLSPPRANLTATPLANGDVLLAGGQDALGQPLDSTAFFNPASASLAVGPSMATAHAGHTATVIDQDHVLVAGGIASFNGTATSATAIFNVQGGGTFLPGDSLSSTRAYHTATALGDGRILLAGGIANPNDPVASVIRSSAEIFTPDGAAGAMTVLPSKMSVERAYHAAVRLPTGIVVLSGGFGADPPAEMLHAVRAETDLFDPASDTFAQGPSMGSARMFHTLTAVNAAGSIVNEMAVPAQAALAVGGGSIQAGNGPSLATAEILIRPLGEPCVAAVECASGYCSDGVCCDFACDGVCDSCSAALKASGADSGVCGPSAAGTHTGATLDSGAAFDTSCTNSVVSYYTCDGAGQKYAYWAESCNGNPCNVDGQTCQEGCNNDPDHPKGCLPEYYCDFPNGPAEGKCTLRLNQGEKCTSPDQCPKPFCVDGVCCESACNETCKSCGQPSSPGSCLPVGAANDPQTPAGTRKCKFVTPGDQGSCAGRCDGTNELECSYLGAETLCGAEKTCACGDAACTVGPATQTRFACDSKGACAASDVADDGAAYVNDCGGYVCDPLAPEKERQCASECAHDAKTGEDTGCLADYYCKGSVCLPRPAGGVCDGTHFLLLPGGIEQDCERLVCPPDGLECVKCTKDEQCTEPPEPSDANEVVCSEQGECVPAPKNPQETACSLGAAPRGRDGLFVIVTCALLALSRRGSRRRRRQG